MVQGRSDVWVKLARCCTPVPGDEIMGFVTRGGGVSVHRTTCTNVAALYEQGKDCGAEANMAKMLAADASWAAADMCVQTHGGFGFAEEFDIERKFRETRLYTVAPISTNLVLSYLAEHVLGLPRSY